MEMIPWNNLGNRWKIHKNRSLGTSSNELVELSSAMFDGSGLTGFIATPKKDRKVQSNPRDKW